eukprot:2487631-Pleurochrysis_carterae.AAC.1
MGAVMGLNLADACHGTIKNEPVADFLLCLYSSTFTQCSGNRQRRVCDNQSSWCPWQNDLLLS